MPTGLSHSRCHRCRRREPDAEHLRRAGPGAMFAAMNSTKNPFPGMNPWLQRKWSDVHTMLIGYIRDSLSPELPPDLAAYAEDGGAGGADAYPCP